MWADSTTTLRTLLATVRIALVLGGVGVTLVALVVGLFLGLPGIVLGPAVGALAFEYAKDPNFGRAAKAGVGTLVGFVVGTVVKVALAFVLSGAVGNLIDRLARGYVVDFVQWHWWNRPDLYWPIFNQADSLIVVGVAMLMLHPGEKREKAPGKSGGAAGVQA